MADIPLSSYAYASSSALTAATSAATAAAAAVGPDGLNGTTEVLAAVQTLPETLQNLSQALRLTALPVSLSQDGQLTLQTEAGDIALQILTALDTPQASALDSGVDAALQTLDSFIQTQKSLSLTLQPGDPPTRATLALSLSSAGESQETASAQAASLKASLQTPQETGMARWALTPGTALTLTVLPKALGQTVGACHAASEALAFSQMAQQAADALAHDGAAHASLTCGPSPALKSAQTSLAAFRDADANAALQEKAPSLQDPAASANRFRAFAQANELSETPASSTTALTLNAPSKWNARLLALAKPGQTLPPALSPTQLAATVVGKGTQHQALLASDQATFYLPDHARALEVGDRLLLDFLAQDLTDLPCLGESQARQGSAMERLMTALQTASAPAALQFAQTRLPQPSAALPVALLLFLKAYGKGGTRAWLGQEVLARLPQTDDADPAGDLADDLAQASGLALDATNAQWRAVPIPFFDGQNYQTLSFFVRQEGENAPSANAAARATQTRFILTLAPSRLGPLQVDGLSQQKKLDIVVRAERSLPEGFAQTCKTSYLQTLDSLGLTGSIAFQTGGEGWIEPRLQTQGVGLTT